MFLPPFALFRHQAADPRPSRRNGFACAARAAQSDDEAVPRSAIPMLAEPSRFLAPSRLWRFDLSVGPSFSFASQTPDRLARYRRCVPSRDLLRVGMEQIRICCVTVVMPAERPQGSVDPQGETSPCVSLSCSSRFWPLYRRLQAVKPKAVAPLPAVPAALSLPMRSARLSSRGPQSARSRAVRPVTPISADAAATDRVFGRHHADRARHGMTSDAIGTAGPGGIRVSVIRVQTREAAPGKIPAAGGKGIYVQEDIDREPR